MAGLVSRQHVLDEDRTYTQCLLRPDLYALNLP